MGLLDDAIREHLELRRRHGASDEEISRKEADALGPARREQPAPPPEGEAFADGGPTMVVPAVDAHAGPADDDRLEQGPFGPPQSFAPEDAPYEWPPPVHDDAPPAEPVLLSDEGPAAPLADREGDQEGPDDEPLPAEAPPFEPEPLLDREPPFEPEPLPEAEPEPLIDREPSFELEPEPPTGPVSAQEPSFEHEPLLEPEPVGSEPGGPGVADPPMEETDLSAREELRPEAPEPLGHEPSPAPLPVSHDIDDADIFPLPDEPLLEEEAALEERPFAAPEASSPLEDELPPEPVGLVGESPLDHEPPVLARDPYEDEPPLPFEEVPSPAAGDPFEVEAALDAGRLPEPVEPPAPLAPAGDLEPPGEPPEPADVFPEPHPTVPDERMSADVPVPRGSELEDEEQALEPPPPPLEALDAEPDIDLAPSARFEEEPHADVEALGPDPFATEEWTAADVDAATGASAGEPLVPHGDSAADDLLDESPDFLQDTPEHDRLWVEQRPPRNFDFDD